MTNVSELFYHRRSRVSRAYLDPDPDPSISDRSSYQNYNRRNQHNHNHTHRHDLDGCDPLRRSPHMRHLGHRLSSLSEHTSVRPDQGTSQFVPGNNLSTETSGSTIRARLNGNDRLPGAVQGSNLSIETSGSPIRARLTGNDRLPGTAPGNNLSTETSGSTLRARLAGNDRLPGTAPGNNLSTETSGSTIRARLAGNDGLHGTVPGNNLSTETSGSTLRARLTGNDRLPGTVLLARARLLERLRGVSLSGNRQSGRASFGMYDREYNFGDELRVVNAGDWGTDISTGLSAVVSPFTDSTSQTESPHTMEESCKKKPPGLTQDALHSLQSEVFSSLEKSVEGDVSQVWDCSICLESFTEGDKLIRLPCEHRFHSACLDPWVRICGDCPYCRRDIVNDRE